MTVYVGPILSSSEGRDDTCLVCDEINGLHAENLVIGERVVGLVRLCEDHTNALNNYRFTLSPGDK